MTKLGRNAPCHCGSGKKYKKCHLTADQASRSESLSEEAPLDSVRALDDIKSLRRQLAELSNQTSVGPSELGELPDVIEQAIEYMERREEIDKAAAQLEAHRAEFEDLCDNDDRYLKLTASLFAEDCFIPLRFNPSEIQAAFDHIGFTDYSASGELTDEQLRAAILHLADKERRSRLSAKLLVQMADYVAAGRYMEGWLLQCLAIQTVDDAKECNPFLFQMFTFGLDEWVAQSQAQDEALFKELGLDPQQLRGMSFDEIQACLAEAASDPARAELLEAHFEQNPKQRQASEAKIEAMQNNSSRLLDRDDIRFLRLSADEVIPWGRRIEERVSQSGLDVSSEADSEAVEELLLQMFRDMASSLFKPDRLQALIDDLKQFQRERFDSKDLKSAELAAGAISYLEGEDSPGLNSFLVKLCWISVSDITKSEGVLE